MLYSHWNEHKSELWGDSDAITMAIPPPFDNLHYLKSSTLRVWLVGYEFLETIMVFMKKQIHVLCTQKKASLLGFVKETAKDAMGVQVVLLVKLRSDDGSGLMDSIFCLVKAESMFNGHGTPVVGYIVREGPEGMLLETWARKLKFANFELIDVTNGLLDLFFCQRQH